MIRDWKRDTFLYDVSRGLKNHKNFDLRVVPACMKRHIQIVSLFQTRIIPWISKPANFLESLHFRKWLYRTYPIQFLKFINLRFFVPSNKELNLFVVLRATFYTVSDTVSVSNPVIAFQSVLQRNWDYWRVQVSRAVVHRVIQSIKRFEQIQKFTGRI